jgi:Polysaccharide lyase
VRGLALLGGVALALVAIVALERSSASRGGGRLPSRNGVVTFQGDWSTGDVSQWNWGAQCRPWLPQADRGTVSVVPAPAAPGRHVARFSLRGSERACEVLHRQSIDLGSDEYYGLAVRFPEDWTRPGPWGAVIAQFNYPSLAGPPVGLFAHANRIDVQILAGNVSWPGCSGPDQGCGTHAEYSAVATVAAPPLVRRVWQEFVVHVRWATHSTGIVDVWHRVQGRRKWIHAYHVAGVPTMQWNPCCVTASGTNPDGSEHMDADKVGLYRQPNGHPIRLYNAGLTVGTTFAAVASRIHPPAMR